MICLHDDENTLLAHRNCGETFSAGTWELLIETSLERGEFYNCPCCHRDIISTDELREVVDPNALPSVDHLFWDI